MVVRLWGLMNDLRRIIRSATPGPGVQFRRKAYGSNRIRDFLRDVIAMANVAIEGSRYIIIGADFDKKGAKRLRSVAQDDFSGKPPYCALVSDFVEPPIRLKYHATNVDGKQLGVFEIGDCQDRPYMMRVDYSEKLRRGDAYTRVNDASIKMGRRQLQDMFERKFRKSVSADQIEVGFPGDIIHKNLTIPTVDLNQMPSVVARTKLKQILDIQSHSKNTGSTTGLIRLAHTQLFGSDNPYDTWTPEKLMNEMSNIETKHHNEDLNFLFEVNATMMQLVIYNQAEEPIRDASLSIAMPTHRAFYVASYLPKISRNGAFVDRSANEQAGYPAVNLKDQAVHVSNTLGEIPAGVPVNVFDTPLRICVGSDLRGRKLGVRYSLFGRNMRGPVKGTLRLHF